MKFHNDGFSEQMSNGFKPYGTITSVDLYRGSKMRKCKNPNIETKRNMNKNLFIYELI